MNNTVRLYMEDWLYTSGLVGFYNILSYSGDSVVIEDNFLEFNEDVLEGFEDKYFNYFIEKYKDVISYYKIMNFESFLDKHIENNFEDFNEDSLKALDTYIRDILKKYLKSNSYKAAYDLINNDLDILELEKKLSGIKLKKKESIEDVIPDVKEQFNIIKQILEYMNQEESKKYIGSKNIIYSVIKNGWDGVCFLNSQTKEKDMYLDYRNYFISPVTEYISSNHEGFKYKCFTCGREMKDLSNNLSFLNNIGFDVAKKSSHVWDFQNDVAVCPICRMIYSCVPAGINYIYDRGIYVNDNTSMKSAVEINRKLYLELYNKMDSNNRLTYRALVNSMLEQENNKIKYELSDIQLIRLENETYRFNILSKAALNIIRNSEEELNLLLKCGYKEIKTYFTIYELVVERILNSQNMFTLIQKLLYYKISQPSDCFFGGFHIVKILNINTRFLEEVGAMTDNNKDMVKLGNASGYYLREKYRQKDAIHKLPGINYRLLNALKTNNKNNFMDTILNCYLYAKVSVPKILLDILESEEEFKTIGYAFVTGLIEGEEKGGKGND